MTDFMKRTDPQDLTKQSHIDTKETIIMNTIDMHDAMVNNMEWEARKAAELNAIYDKRYNECSGNNSHYENQSYNNPVDMSSVNERLDSIERKIDELRNLIVSSTSNNRELFVFAPKKNINAGVSFGLTENQFNALLRRISK